MKYLFISLAFFIFQFSFAQLTITNLDDGTPILDGDSFEFDTTVFEDAKLKFVISNSSSTETINVLAEMVSFTNTNGSNLQFCVAPECFFNVSSGSTIPNSPIVLAPGEDNGNFDYFSNSNPGDGENYPMTFTIRFFMLDGNDVEVGDDITITYNYTPENFSVNQFDLNDMGITLENTVVEDFLNLNLEKKISIDIYDLNAKRIENYNLTSGQHELNMSNLQNGYYFLKFSDQNNRNTTLKILKR